MLRLRFRHSNGQVYDLPATDVMVEDSHGQPVSCTYEECGLVIHCDRTHDDWALTVERVGLKSKEQSGER